MSRVLKRIAALVACLFGTICPASHGWTIASRELVDLQFAADDSLIILVSAPSATEPGIYRWLPNAPAPTLLCKISSPASFSFDRKTIVERVAGASPELQIYSPSTCALGPRLGVEGRALDVDVHGKHVAVVLRLADVSNELRIYALTGRELARTDIGRNVEIGFAPDGLSVVNFDFNDSGGAAWSVPTLATEALPAWFGSGETTFVPGGSFVKRYVDAALSVAQWPSGKPLFSATMPRSARLRQLSSTGRFGLLHAHGVSGESLDWLDFLTAKRVRIASGSIDNATINGSGTRVAWAQRGNDATQRVDISVEPVVSGR
jgi:hypothetical protein